MLVRWPSAQHNQMQCAIRCEWGAEWHLMMAKLPTHTESTCTPPTFKQAIAHTQTHTSDTVTAVVTRRSFTRPCAWSIEIILLVTLNKKEWKLMKPSWERRKEEASSHLSNVESRMDWGCSLAAPMSPDYWAAKVIGVQEIIVIYQERKGAEDG